MQITADWLTNETSQKLLRTFTSCGFEAFFVGGCVRNAILNRAVSDLDVATSAPPQSVLKIAHQAGIRTIPTGLDHGTITLRLNRKSFEVTTFRKDIVTDGRHATVKYSDNVLDDARRRDFTMNAFYVGADGTVLDPLDGLPDLLAGCVRFIEDANTRIQEDYLRALRYFRFFALYGDTSAGTDPNALDAITRNLDGLKNISKERVGEEIRKLLAADNPAPAVAAMESTGVLNCILPGSCARALGPLVHNEQNLQIRPQWIRRLLVLGAKELKINLRLSNAEAKRERGFLTAAQTPMPLAELGYRFGENTALDVYLVQSALTDQPVEASAPGEILRGSKARFPLTGKDISTENSGEFSGRAIGERLRALENEWIKSDFTKTKPELLA